MISQTFDLLRTLITLFSMLLLLLQLAWWLAVVAIVVPIPSFIANSRYGWIGYMRMRREAPERRMLLYLNSLMTADDYNQEIKAFKLGNYFIQGLHPLSDKFLEET